MVPVAEFFLTTLWTYKPEIVKQVIDKMNNAFRGKGEITFDNEFKWFKVECLRDQEDNVRKHFNAITCEIEDDAFNACEDDMLNLNDTLEPSFDNKWFSNSPSCQGDGIHQPYHHPGDLAKYPHAEAWDDLDKNNEPYTAEHIMTDFQQYQLRKELRVRFSFTLGKRLVHIGGRSNELVCEARQRLRVLLTIRKLTADPIRAENVVYAEHHIDPVRPEPDSKPGFTADIRYMANIDPKLALSTLLDRLKVNALENAYRSMYQKACSIRLCPWVPSKMHCVSLFGPKVDARPRDRTKLKNRPSTSTKSFDELAVAADEPSLPTQSQSQKAANPVETWIEKLPAHVGSVVDTTHPLLNAQAAGRPPSRDTSEDLMDFGDESSASCYGAPIATPSGTMAGTSGATPAVGNHIPSICRDFSALQASSGTSSIETESDFPRKGLAFTGDDCLIDMLAAVETTNPKDAPRATVNWKMQPLVPSLMDKDETGDSEALLTSHPPAVAGSPTQEQNATSSPQADRRHPQQGTAASNLKDSQGKEGAKGVQATKRQGTAQQAKSRKPLNSHGVPSANTQPRQPSSHDTKAGVSDQPLATKDFEDEIESAMVKHLFLGPYRRGRIAVRAEFGRTILTAVSVSGLAFNNENTKSNGWWKPTLIEELNKNYGNNKDIHFTNILSTYAYDIEDMINTKAQGVRLWEEKPDRSWTTYSFHCVMSFKDALLRFIVDIEDDGSSSGNFSYSIRCHDNAPSDDKPVPLNADEPMPLYVHAICRHWDLRIVTSHAKTDELEKNFGAFARSLLKSLSVCPKEKGDGNDLKFAIPNDTPVEVKDIRTLTKWRHLSLDKKSALEITEVQQLEMMKYSGDDYCGSWSTFQGYLARPWSAKRSRENRDKGECPLWYEAAVVSLELEKLCGENALLRVGQKAGWEAKDLRARGIFPSLYRPALQMLKQMDHVGRLDDNHLAAKYGNPSLRRGNDAPRSIPGLAVQQGQQGQQGQRRAGAVSDGPRFAGAGNMSARNPRGPSRSENAPGFW